MELESINYRVVDGGHKCRVRKFICPICGNPKVIYAGGTLDMANEGYIPKKLRDAKKEVKKNEDFKQYE